ncbi:MAG: adenosine deaminase, partial [Burkholderiales bacterium]|nr:adenosine deaminase [Opitutaceae bacterium]
MLSHPTDELREFVLALPKTETHLHLEGACPFELLQKLDPIKYAAPPPFWADDYRYDNFDAFMRLYLEYCAAFFTSAERYHEAAKIVLARCAAQGCRYVETSFHLPALAYLRESGPEVIRAIRAAAPRGLELRVFGGMSHNDYAGAGRELIDDALGWPELDGIDLHGWEDIPLEPWTDEVWARARKAGKFTKAHAGEFMPASFVDLVLDRLRVTRIEHGVRSIESPATVARLLREGVALDVCPISNLKLAVRGVPTLAAHPIRRLFDAGVIVTVSSDDPFFFGNTLADEYHALHEHLGFSRAELVRVAANGFRVALLPEH